MSRLALLLALLVSVACSSPKAPANQDASGDVVTSDTSTLDAPETTGLDVTPNDGVADDTSPGDVSSFDSTGELGQPCRTSNDCKSRSGAYCLTPGTTVCGICRTPQSPCQTHTDCASIDNSYVCDSLRAQTGCPYCNGPAAECVPPCAKDSECTLNASCQNGLCTRVHCASDASCPSQHVCKNPGVDGTCARRSCAVDGDCPDGVCVNGGCYPSYGTCSLPVP